jgi:hypothetical protein
MVKTILPPKEGKNLGALSEGPAHDFLSEEGLAALAGMVARYNITFEEPNDMEVLGVVAKGSEVVHVGLRSNAGAEQRALKLLNIVLSGREGQRLSHADVADVIADMRQVSPGDIEVTNPSTKMGSIKTCSDGATLTQLL